MTPTRLLLSALLILATDVQAAPFDWPVYPVEQGNQSYAEGKYEDALEQYEGVEEQLTGEQRLQFNRGDALFKLQRFKEAREAFLRASGSDDLELKKRNYYNIGNTFLAEGSLPDAIDYYRRALQIDPTFEDARFNLELAVRALKQQKDQQDKNKQDKNQKDKKDDKQGKQQDKQQDDSQDKKEQEKQKQQEHNQKQDQKQEQEQKQDQKQDQKQSAQQANQQQQDQERQNQQDLNKPQEQPSGPEEKRPEGKLSQMQVNDLLDAARENEKPFQLYRFQLPESKLKNRKVEKDW